MSHAAELIVLTNQGATPGVKELAAAFARASGHKVTVIQEDGRRWSRDSTAAPRTLITGNPRRDGGLVKKGQGRGRHGDAVRARRSRPFGARRRAETRHQHGRSLQGDIARGEVDRLFARLQRPECRGGDRAARPHRAVEAKDVLTGGGTVPVTLFLARGDFEIGIQQTNIMVGVPGTDYVGPLPGFLNKPCQPASRL